MATQKHRTVSWTGTAKVFAGDRVIDIGVETKVTPYLSARSDTWLLSEGPASRRSLIIEPDGGWIERDGRREPMPEAMLRHERQQFAIYGLIQFAAEIGPVTRSMGRDRGNVRASEHNPATELIFDTEGRLVEARNSVDDPEGKGEQIDQVFRFSGEVEDAGVIFPRTIEIFQRGERYFTLTIDSFTAGPPLE